MEIEVNLVGGYFNPEISKNTEASRGGWQPGRLVSPLLLGATDQICQMHLLVLTHTNITNSTAIRRPSQCETSVHTVGLPEISTWHSKSSPGKFTGGLVL